MASWYSVADNGGTVTASGIPYNEHASTCAHKTAKFGTVYLVTNTRNGKTTTCTVTDRGPYIKGRVIDVSRKGAQELGMLHSGIAPVKLAVVADPFLVDRQDLPPVVEKQPKPRRSKVSQGRGKNRSLGQRPRPKTKPLDAWQVTRRNLHST
jgi:rare lipoprotein A (peptidoglycan hydrolase)